MHFVFLFLLPRKMYIETFHHTLVYIIKCISILFYSCRFYTCLDCLVLIYTCLYMHIYIHICYKDFSIHVSLKIRVYMFVNIYLSKLCYQYICLDILAFIQLSVHACLYILFYKFIYTSWTIHFFLILLYIPFLSCYQALIQINFLCTYRFWEQEK